MNFTPKKEQIFVAALRSHIHNRIAKRGINERDIYFLRKIYLFEATHFPENYIGSYDLFRLADTLFGAAVIYTLKSEKTLFTSLNGKGDYSVNIRLFEIAVATLSCVAENGATLCFFALSDGVVLSVSKVKQKPLIIYPESLNLYCAQNGRFSVFLPLDKTVAKEQIKNETEYLRDRYSAFNVFNCL